VIFASAASPDSGEQSPGEEHFNKHPTVRLNDVRSADSRCGLANATLLKSTRRHAASHMANLPLLSERYDCGRVGGPVERETWWMKSESLGVVGLALGSVFLTSLFLNALT
jgi:hypothetical protein